MCGVKMIYLLLLSLNAFAQTGFVKETDLGKRFGATIYYDGSCPGPCYSVESNQEVEVMGKPPSGNVAVVDPARFASKQDRLAIEAMAEATKAQEVADKEADVVDIKSSGDINDLTDKLDKLIFLLQEKGIISK